MKLVRYLLLLIISGCSEGDVGHQERRNVPDSRSAVAVQNESSPQKDAEEVLLKYLNAQLKAGMSGKSKETYRLISQRDKDATTEGEYLASVASSASSLSQAAMSAIREKISYTIKTSVAEAYTVTIGVETSFPDFPDDLRTAIVNTGNAELEQKVLSYLKSDGLRFKTSVDSYVLVKEADGWRVFLDFAKEKKIRALVDQAEELVPSLQMLRPLDGVVLESMKPKLLSAQEKYKEALSLGDDFRAKNNLKYLEEKIEKLRFYEQYKDKVEIRNVQVAEGRYGGKGVFGEVKNNGDVALTRVGIIIYLLDKSGNAVHEMTYHPVFVTKKSFGEDEIPLKPNYTRQFGYKADSAPNDWAEKVRVVVSDIGVE